jgi:hypothetical protein
MKRMTRAVAVAELRDLVERPPRAMLAFVSDGRIEALAVLFRYEAGHYLLRLPPGLEAPVGRVKLLVDDGPWYFDLRGLWARGALVACAPPTGARLGEPWFELQAEKVAAWHYGRMRER